jgi:hypothetical protein
MTIAPADDNARRATLPSNARLADVHQPKGTEVGLGEAPFEGCRTALQVPRTPFRASLSIGDYAGGGLSFSVADPAASGA